LAGWELRSEERHQQMRERDPLRIATEQVLASKLLKQSDIERINEEAKAEVEAAELFADESPIARPTEEELLAAVYAD
jgi:pyruvate dehydrogenase E1 component alpha subunit